MECRHHGASRSCQNLPRWRDAATISRRPKTKADELIPTARQLTEPGMFFQPGEISLQCLRKRVCLRLELVRVIKKEIVDFRDGFRNAIVMLSFATCSTSHAHTGEEIDLGLTMKTTASASRINPSSSRRQSSSFGRSRVSILGSKPRASSAATMSWANARSLRE
jgi:hypothetical protein